MASISSTYLKLITSSSTLITQHNSYRFAYARRYNDNDNDNGPTLFLSPRQPRCQLSSWSPASRTSAAPPRAAVVAADALVRDAGATALVISVWCYGQIPTLTAGYVAQQGLLPSVAYCMSEFEQKAGPYIVWAAFHGILATFQSSTSTEARYFASIVPLTNCLRLLIHGLSLANNEALLKSVTREGKPEYYSLSGPSSKIISCTMELLRGPLYYVLMLALCAVVFWRESPIGVISLSMMCGGDGIADIMGRKFGHIKLPYNQDKSWAGSISMFAFGFLISIGMLYYFSALGYFKLDWVVAMKKVALVSLVATAIESLPITKLIDDNIAVPIATMVMAYFCFC
ncbi:hypothetical protein Cgig2_029291 [Carnegiea gigantea]|uniref:phytol kinase n=1 Tax=Carnegiea gigantea TaxID=171969 RepID=A0A9Q1KUH4_9CARY|nr:hypothetical protein Cgig2_029291 [Carnegiea gigantea]